MALFFQIRFQFGEKGDRAFLFKEIVPYLNRFIFPNIEFLKDIIDFMLFESEEMKVKGVDPSTNLEAFP